MRKNPYRMLAVFALTGSILAAGLAMSAEPARNGAVADPRPANFDESITNARRALTRKDFDAAQGGLDAARAAAEATADETSSGRRLELRVTIARAQLALNRARQDSVEETAPRRIESCTAGPLTRSPLEQRRVVRELSKTSWLLMLHGEVAKARAVLGQVRTIDPGNRYARAALHLFDPVTWLVAILAVVGGVYVAAEIIRRRRHCR